MKRLLIDYILNVMKLVIDSVDSLITASAQGAVCESVLVSVFFLF